MGTNSPRLTPPHPARWPVCVSCAKGLPGAHPSVRDPPGGREALVQPQGGPPRSPRQVVRHAGSARSPSRVPWWWTGEEEGADDGGEQQQPCRRWLGRRRGWGWVRSRSEAQDARCRGEDEEVDEGSAGERGRRVSDCGRGRVGRVGQSRRVRVQAVRRWSSISHYCIGGDVGNYYLLLL